MGWSKSKTKTSTKTAEKSTITPTNPQWVTDAVQGHTQRINDFAARDPYSMVAGLNGLQMQAASLLGGGSSWSSSDGKVRNGWQGGANLAEGVKLAGPSSFNASTFDGAKLGGPATFGGIKLGGPATFGGVTIGDMEKAAAEQGVKYLKDYENPYTEKVVDTSLAGFDENAGQVRAAQAAAAARNRAFSGSRFGIQAAQTEQNLARERAATEAGLRSQAFNTAAGYGMMDADRFTNVGMFNAGQENQRTLTQAQLDQQTGMFNTGAQNDFTLAQAGYDAQTGMFNAGQQNQFALTQGGFDQQAGMFNADARNQASQFNAGAQNQFALAQGDMDSRNNMFNAGQQDSAQQRELARIGMLGDMGNAQWAVEQARAQAPLQQMQALAGLHSSNPYGLFSGRETSGTMTGTQTKTQPGGWGMGLLGGFSNMFSFAPINTGIGK